MSVLWRKTVYFGDKFGTKPTSGVLRKKERKQKASDQYIPSVKTVLLTFCQFSSVPCRTECIVMVPVYCEWRSDGRLSVLWCQTEYTVMEDRVYCGGRLDVLRWKTGCTVMEDECNVTEALMEHRAHWMIIIKVLIQRKILSSRTILRARAHTHRHTEAPSHTHEWILCWIECTVVGWVYSDGGAVGTPCVRYAGLCTVGWVYCGGSGGTLGVHYAGLSVLWDGCIVMEGRMEHWVYTMLD